jgi:hypothetical protein
MAEIITNGSFETEGASEQVASGWLHTSAARVDDFPTLKGNWCVALGQAVGGGGQVQTTNDATIVNNTKYRFSYWLKPDPDNLPDFNVDVLVKSGAGSLSHVQFSGDYTTPSDDWELFTYDFTSNGTAFKCEFENRSSNGKWLVDLVGLESFLSIKLAERPVRAVVALLQAQLATELSAIDTDRGDSITMVAPAAGDYSAYEREVVDGKDGAAHVEVFEGPVGFNDPYGTAVNRAVFDCPINIRVTYFGRIGAETLSDIRTRCRRYTAGIYNVIGQHRDLSDSDDATQLITANRVLPITEINAQKVQQIVEATVRCEEDYS